MCVLGVFVSFHLCIVDEERSGDPTVSSDLLCGFVNWNWMYESDDGAVHSERPAGRGDKKRASHDGERGLPFLAFSRQGDNKR